MYRFNKYSWILAVLYSATMITMERHSYTLPYEGFYLTIPIILVFILWSERMTPLLKDERDLNKTESFNRDLFLINFSIIVAELLSFLSEYKNSDLIAWWPLALWFITIFGFLFAFLFSLIALIFDNHNKYTFIFGILIILVILPFSFLAYTMPFSIFANHYAFYVVMGSLLTVHLILGLGYKILQSQK